ncbi:hypothetical protein J2S09_000184 [Bacillus fengqiuensis]|nr:hypothetical protein [Bacillus fengqiuensis]
MYTKNVALSYQLRDRCGTLNQYGLDGAIKSKEPLAACSFYFYHAHVLAFILKHRACNAASYSIADR